MLLEYPDESMVALLKVKTGWGLFVVSGWGRGELREEREEELPMPSLEDRRFSCENMSMQLPGSPPSGVKCPSPSSNDELDPLNKLPFC